jgi:hypothetical protein
MKKRTRRIGMTNLNSEELIKKLQDISSEARRKHQETLRNLNNISWEKVKSPKA